MTKVDIAILLNLTEFFLGEILQQYKKKGGGGGWCVCGWCKLMTRFLGKI